MEYTIECISRQKSRKLYYIYLAEILFPFNGFGSEDGDGGEVADQTEAAHHGKQNALQQELHSLHPGHPGHPGLQWISYRITQKDVVKITRTAQPKRKIKRAFLSS